ncbi:MAG: quinone-dependent dihydroorotate dehydrogenase, partial [Bdellovibrionales bacterium]|nr:quinone-dependent dihydroorotate dehydrogenase [Bdellovibrionales bacterium]
MQIYDVFKSMAFKMDPEKAHDLSMWGFSKFPLIFSGLFKQQQLGPQYSLEVAGLNWSFPVGLAAGLDKNAQAIDFFSKLYFGAIEVGTITPRPQAGNDKPRLFRYVNESSLRNRMGFNNLGMEEAYHNLKKCEKNSKIIGVNLGKNKTTTETKAADDYKVLYDKLAPLADYLVVNVSSPNTPGLRDLQSADKLKEIFLNLKESRKTCPKPLFLKISPDMAMEDIPSTVEVVKEFDLSGIIATNTTIMKERGDGGISGKLLYEKSFMMRNKILEILAESPQVELIGVGGISQFDDLVDFWKRGG